MKTKSSPSEYRYCISRRSTVAVSTLVPALNVRSTTWPVSTFFSLVRTNAPPLPGFTCWNSTTFHSTPSRSSVMPFFRSLVVAIGRVNPSRRSVRRPPRLPKRSGAGSCADAVRSGLPDIGLRVDRGHLNAVRTGRGVVGEVGQLVSDADLHHRGVRHPTGSRGERDLGRPRHRESAGADRVRVSVHEERRHLLADIGGIALGRGLVRLLLLGQEQWDGDRSEDADDDHDDEELDQGEALITAVDGGAEPC